MFNVEFGDFFKTTVSVSAADEAARNLFAEIFGKGAVSAEIFKSHFQSFAEFVASRGLKLNLN